MLTKPQPSPPPSVKRFHKMSCMKLNGGIICLPLYNLEKAF